MSTIAQNKQAQLPGPDQNDSPDHIQRVQDELRAAGATLYGLAKFSSQYLHRLIHANEHIYGAVYGRYRGGRGILSLTEGMLVATDHRIIFLDYKPGFTAVEEIAYHAVAGIDYITAGPFSSVTLHTRIGEFSLRYANSNCIRHFVAYVETRQIDEREPRRMQSLAEGVPHDDAPTANSMPITPDTLTFLHDHNVAVLSTVSRNGQVHGAAVNYLFDMSGVLYILTKSTTRKAQNLLTNQQAALTIYDEGRLQTVQIHGRADREQRPETQGWAFRTLCWQHTQTQGNYISPATTAREGQFIVFRITPDTVRFIDFALKRDEAPGAEGSIAGNMPEA